MEIRQITELLQLIDEPNRSACYKLFKDNKIRFYKSPGSLTKHQAWEGGYIHHLEEAMSFAIAQYKLMDDFRKQEFSLSDLLLVLFLHDLEKPWRYVDPKTVFSSDEQKNDFIREMAEKYGIVLTADHLNGLKYIHGEGKDYSRTKRIAGPLATVAHVCDDISARVWFDYPKKR